MTSWFKSTKKKNGSKKTINYQIADPIINTAKINPETATAKGSDTSDLSVMRDTVNDSATTPVNVRSVLSAGTVITGKLSFDTPVRIDGKLTGEIFSSETVLIGETAKIDAAIHVKKLIVLGKVKGTVNATEGIEIRNGGVLNADITTSSLVINGGRFSGNCKMPKAA